MSPATKKFQEMLIRMLRGCLSAWEEWLNSQR